MQSISLNAQYTNLTLHVLRRTVKDLKESLFTEAVLKETFPSTIAGVTYGEYTAYLLVETIQQKKRWYFFGKLMSTKTVKVILEVRMNTISAEISATFNMRDQNKQSVARRMLGVY